MERGIASMRLDLMWWRAWEPLAVGIILIAVLALSWSTTLPPSWVGLMALGGIVLAAWLAFSTTLTVEVDREGVSVHRWLSPGRKYPWPDIVAVNVKEKKTWTNWNLMREYTYYCCELILEGRPAVRLYAGDVSRSRLDAEMMKDLIDQGRERWDS